MNNYTDYLKDTIRKKQAHEVRVNNILNSLVSSSNTQSFVSKALLYLSTANYKEASIRRSDQENCGYLLCDNDIKIASKVTTLLDPKNKKIYNVEMRKRYCSDWCYAAYNHIHGQLNDKNGLNEPSKSTEFTFYDPNGDGCPGDLMFTEENYLSKEMESCKIVSDKENIVQKEIKINDRPENVKHEQKLNKINDVIKQLDHIIHNGVVKKDESKKSLQEVIKKVNESQNMKKDRKIIYLDEIISENNVTISKDAYECRAMIQKIIKSVWSWLTMKSKDFLANELKIEYGEKSNYEVDCYSFLQPLDHEHQFLIRRSILMKRIRSCGMKILSSLEVSIPEFFNVVQLFWKTCELTSQNIMFSTAEFKILTLVLVNLLKKQLSSLKSESVCINLPDVVVDECKLTELGYFMSEMKSLIERIEYMSPIEEEEDDHDEDNDDNDDDDDDEEDGNDSELYHRLMVKTSNIGDIE